MVHDQPTSSQIVQADDNSQAVDKDPLKTMAQEVDSGQKPFPFMHLPLEIQRLVFKKYYEDPWVVGYDAKEREIGR